MLARWAFPRGTPAIAPVFLFAWISYHVRSKVGDTAGALGIPTRSELAGQLKAAARQLQAVSNVAALRGPELPVTML